MLFEIRNLMYFQQFRRLILSEIGERSMSNILHFCLRVGNKSTLSIVTNLCATFGREVGVLDC